MMSLQLENITRQVIEVAKASGAMIKAERKNFSSSSIEVKGLHDFVSYVDKTSEEQIIKALNKIFPEAGFIAEEGSGYEKSSGLNWIVDPLDGTTNFIHGVPVFSVSIALMANHEIVIGVVYEINHDECFYAWKGSIAYLNEKEINVSEVTALKDSLLATGFPYYDYSRLDPYIDFFKYLVQNTHGVRRLGSAAVDLAYTACGRFEGFYEYGLNSWDVAAGSLIVKQAGGLITDFSGGGNFVFGRELIATNRLIHHEMLDSLGKFFR